MKQPELARKVFDLIENNKMDEAAKLLSDDFVFSGPVPDPLNRGKWLELQSLLGIGFPDWSFNFKYMHNHGSDCHCSVQITGTHTRDLDLTALGLQVIPKTGSSIKLPKEDLMIEFNGEKISAIKVVSAPGGGLDGILNQIGVGILSK